MREVSLHFPRFTFLPLMPTEELSETVDCTIVMLDSGLQQVLGLGFSASGYPTCFPPITPSLMIITNY